jgi:hypothetical protein
MDKEFCPYEQALALKELGFDGKTLKSYDTSVVLVNGKYLLDNWYDVNTLKAPLYQQAFRWFREEHNLYSTIALISNGLKDRAYMPMIDYIYPHKAIMDFVEYETHEESELECLKKLIEIVKEKNHENSI